MSQPPGARPIVIAHRGGAGEAPENTMEAFERAIRLGYPGVEFDVRMSKDGVPVVAHDRWVRPAKDHPFRPVDDLTAAEIAVVPTLEAVLALPWGRMTLMVEVKPTDRDEELGDLVARAIVARRLESQAIMASFAPAVLRSGRKAAPAIRLMGLFDDQGAEGAQRAFAGLPLFAWGIEEGWLAEDQVKSYREGGRQIWIWTISDLDQMRGALALGVDGLITDIPGAVLAAL